MDEIGGQVASRTPGSGPDVPRQAFARLMRASPRGAALRATAALLGGAGSALFL